MQDFAPSSYREDESNGITHKAFFCYFKVKLNAGTLKCELTEKHCSFLVNLMTDNNCSVVSYEQFLDFIIPRTKKKISKTLINKIKQTNKALENGQVAKCKYNAICTLAKLFECEIQVMKKIQK